MSRKQSTVTWHIGSLGWSCVGKDVPLEEFGPERQIRKATYPPTRVGQLKVYALCPKCGAHDVFIGWKEE